MKLTDFLEGVGRPVAYFPKLKRITGSTTATILLCQFIYWRGKEADGEGWLYKTSDEIEDETGLTYNEQKTARKYLVLSGLLQEHYARLDHQIRFKIDLDKINEIWGTEQYNVPESDDSMLANSTSLNSLNSIAEITTETTTETTTEDAKNIVDVEGESEHDVKRGSAEWKVKLGEEVSKTSIEAAIYAGAKVTQAHVNKQQEVLDLEVMIDAQLARLPLNWTGFQDKDQDNFRKFLKKQRKEFGRELDKWVNWWMSDEWRVANPPWKLDTIKIKWLEAFKNESKPVTEVQTDENDIPRNY